MTASRDTFRPPLTIRAALQAATRALAESSASASSDAEVLVQHASGLTRADVLAHPERALSEAACGKLAALIERRRRGEPIAYITGRREFWSLDLAVSPATLIPRAETEVLVERALARIPADAVWTVADLGTGSGAVALAIAHERPRSRLMATDCSADALAVARTNAEHLQIGNVEFAIGEWFAPLRGRRFHVVVSNPPYVRATDPHLQTGDLRFEPLAALVGGADGLDAIRRISAAAPSHLHPDGWLLLEHGYDQGADVRALLTRIGYQRVRSYRDLLGHQRVTEGQFS